jgi:hypothetical protein
LTSEFVAGSLMGIKPTSLPAPAQRSIFLGQNQLTSRPCGWAL